MKNRLKQKRICYSAKKEVVEKSIEKIRGFGNTKLTHYLDMHVIPVLSKFSRAFITSFTGGYNVSSLSESANSLLKRNLTAAYYTFAELKTCIRNVFRQINTQEKLLFSRRNGSFLEKEFGIAVYGRVEVLLVSSLVKSFRLEKVDENTYSDTRWPDEVFKVDYPNCECGKLQYVGLPCSHLMRWLMDHNMNPMKLVSLEYQTNVPYAQVRDYVPRSCDMLATLIYSNFIRFKRSILTEFEHEMREDQISQPTNGLLLTTGMERTHIVRYNEILGYAKDLARKASQTEEDTNKAIEQLNKILNEMEDANDTDIGHEGAYEPTRKRKGRGDENVGSVKNWGRIKSFNWLVQTLSKTERNWIKF